MTLDRSIPRDSWPTEATDPLRDLEAGSRRAKRNGGEKGERRAGEKRTEPRGTNRGEDGRGGGDERERERGRESRREGKNKLHKVSLSRVAEKRSFLKAVGSNEILMTFSWVKRSRQSRWRGVITGPLLSGWSNLTNRGNPPPKRSGGHEEIRAIYHETRGRARPGWKKSLSRSTDSSDKFCAGSLNSWKRNEKREREKGK